MDLTETFNWLLGLKVSSRKVYLRDGKLRYLVIHGTTNPHGADSVIPGARVLDVVFKERMFAPVAV